jgi:hypothetical protein
MEKSRETSKIISKKEKTIRDIRQEEFATVFIKKDCHGILYLCPRFGKIRTTINILEKLKPKSILVAYPDKTIEKSWKNDFIERGYDDKNVTYTTHLSIKKYVDQKFDMIVLDEIHLLSEAQKEQCAILMRQNKIVLGLTGTLSSKTEDEMNFDLGLYVLARYPIEQAILEKVIVDYEIRVIKVPLDDVIKEKNKRGQLVSEKKKFLNATFVINKLQRQGDSAMFMRLNRMRIIQNSIAKLNKTKDILRMHKDERILVFTGTIKAAETLNIPVHHSKSDSKEDFEKFVEGQGNHMAVVKIGNTGLTYMSLDKVIIQYFDSNAENLSQKINRCMALEFNTPDKKALIYIICTTESVELKWLEKALEFFDKTKIKYVK